MIISTKTTWDNSLLFHDRKGKSHSEIANINADCFLLFLFVVYGWWLGKERFENLEQWWLQFTFNFKEIFEPLKYLVFLLKCMWKLQKCIKYTLLLVSTFLMLFDSWQLFEIGVTIFNLLVTWLKLSG